MHGDNQGTLSLIKNSQVSRRTEHIDVRYHYLRDCVEAGEIRFHYCATESLPALHGSAHPPTPVPVPVPPQSRGGRPGKGAAQQPHDT
jgi:hypothetical protein